MKPKLNAVIIGAGGVTSYMLPALKNSFDLTATIIDGDKLEKHNLDRQLFRNNAVGQYKAVALLKQYNFRKNEGHAVREYFSEDMLNTEYTRRRTRTLISRIDNTVSVTIQLAKLYWLQLRSTTNLLLYVLTNTTQVRRSTTTRRWSTTSQ